ncbi:DUF2125 domain-containing protein [Sulfitobacter donghicola]|nr:DUF2125 domain-containing protein [Sulfitobacter donghicola]KIN68597.1 DUF2125 domain containing protein [Sulfitobacter donghicola DSW-25 = KCTC 12864 = JCM 14565]
MGRLAIKIVTFLAVVLGAWWWVATNGLVAGMNAWLEDRRSEGLQIEVADISRHGFPLKIASSLTDMQLTDPQTASRVDIPKVTVSTPIYWPGDATITLPATPITFASPHATLTFSSSGATAAMRLHPGTALQLEALKAESSQVSLDLVEGRVLAIEDIQIDVLQTTDEQTYDIDLTADGFAPGSIIRQSLGLPVSWPAAFETLVADMTVTFDRPWDKSALEHTRPQPTAIKIDQINAAWADLNIFASADLQVAQGGIPSGTFTLKAQNWQRMLDVATTSGAMNADMRAQAESILGLLAGLSGNADTLDVEITIDQGRMRMGFVPLGNAPRIILR